MFRKVISMFILVLMILAMIPMNTTYATPSVTSMKKTKMSINAAKQWMDAGYNFSSYSQMPNSTGPVYDDPTNRGHHTGTWKKDTIDGKGITWPGQRDTATMGFCVSLEDHKLLGATLKGQLKAYVNAYYDNYKGDDDYGVPFMEEYNRDGKSLGKVDGDKKSVSNWVNNNFTMNVYKNTAYIIFGIRGERSGGVFNSDLDLNVNNIYGMVKDTTAPEVIKLENGSPHIPAEAEKLKQNKAANEPDVYLTMSEDISSFSNMVVTLTASDGSTYNVGLESLGKDSFNYSNGDVKYKFRIMTENISVQKHFEKVTLYSMLAKDTIGNFTTNTKNISCNKRVDTKAPIINMGSTPNVFSVNDYFGLSKVTKTIKTNTINNAPVSITETGTDIAVVNAVKNSNFIIENTTPNTGLFKVTIDAWDLVNNYTKREQDLFMISNKQPVEFTLQNSSNPMFNISPSDVDSNTKNALTNMYLKTDIDSKYLSGATIYYKWNNIYDESILTNSPDSSWSQVSFAANKNTTNEISIPVEMKSQGMVNYLGPKYSEGYLYIIPKIDDDTTLSTTFRAGSMALTETGIDTNGKFNLVDSNPSVGQFINRGCECTGQQYTGETAEEHYSAIRNHTKDIGFDVTINNDSLSSIKYFISPKSNINSYISSGTINKNDSGQYNIPISSISGKTGNYVVMAALYSKMGDVTVQKINVNIESPVIGISNIMYNQTNQNLDFTVTYNKNTLFDENINSVNIELSDKDFTEFQDPDSSTGLDPQKISFYAISEGGIILKDNWDTLIGDKQFIRTEFIEDSNDSNLMKADFRASLSNMETAGDEFIKKAGAKRVHIKYTTSNNVQSFHNNIAVINKSNVPPSINLVGGIQGSYLTSTEYNGAVDSAIRIKITEPIVNLQSVYYDWVESANSSLVQDNGLINGKEILGSDGDGTIELAPKDIPQVIGEILFKPYYLAVYAKNTAGKYIEKTFGPFFVLNENINDIRFNITATDKSLGEKQILVAVDDKLHMIDKLQKPNKLRVVWQKFQTSVAKTYDISFVDKANADETTNLAVINIPYIELFDTDGEGGTFNLGYIEVYNSEDETNIYKTVFPDNISQTLPEHFVIIDGLNIKSDEDTILYNWSRNPYTIPVTWITTQGAITGIDFVPDQKTSIINSKIYFFAKAWNNIYRSDKINLENTGVLNELAVSSIKIGEAENGYYGSENGSKEDTLIRIIVNNSWDIDEIAKVECYDLLSLTSNSAIKVSKMFKISDKEIAGFIPSLVTSEGAIKCNVSINGFDTGKTITSENVGEMPISFHSKLSIHRVNRNITLTNISEYTKYNLYQSEGKSFVFDETGKTEIYENGEYLLVYRDHSNLFAKIISVSGIEYDKDDIKTTLTPNKPSEGKVTEPVTVTIAMPMGSVIKDKYGVIENVTNVNDEVVASFTTTRSAIYTFNVKFANEEDTDYVVDLSYIGENYTPILTTVTSSTAITYNPEGTTLTKNDVVTTLQGIAVLNNNNVNNYIFDKNGSYSFVAKDADGNLIEYKSSVDWIDKSCPEPVVKKYVWYDFNLDGLINSGEKGSEIPKGYKTKHDVIVEIEFPHDKEADRPVKLSEPTNFIIEELSSTDGFAYKYVMAYKPTTDDTTPDFRQKLIFTDTLANTLTYNLVIDEIDRTDLLTKLNYSTTNYTNRDVVVSMSANRAIKRFDKIEVIDDSGNVTTVEKDAAPTYVFKENGTKDFNYRQIEVVPGEEESGKLTANVTWIDKSIPSVKTEYNNKATNLSVEIEFTVLDGVKEGARLKYNSQLIALKDTVNDRVGTYTVNKNGIYTFEVSNKYGNIGDVIVPINNIDKEAPILNITGRNNVYLRVNDKYYDKGATALDNKDGDITKGINVDSNVNISIPTNDVPYEVTYTVTDASGNISIKTRYVHVLDINSAVAIVQDNVIDLKSKITNNISLPDSGVIFVEFIGIDGNYIVKYARGENYDNAYFKTNGSYMSKLGTFTVQEGVYTLYIQDQERNTRIITLNFVK